jgi:pyruvate ferredoxin oxidoreductase gamma subunit
MAQITEIRWHGRGGQGAKTAALLFGDAALSTGLHIQAFPEYGPERMGAPVQSFNRLSPEPISLHCGVTSPDVVVVLDPTLMETVDVAQGLKPDGILLVNCSTSPAAIREQLNLDQVKVFTVDASRISREILGREIPNTPMLGAMVKVTGMLDFEKMLADIEKKLHKKFRDRPKVVKGNIESIKKAYEEVRSE